MHEKIRAIAIHIAGKLLSYKRTQIFPGIKSLREGHYERRKHY